MAVTCSTLEGSSYSTSFDEEDDIDCVTEYVHKFDDVALLHMFMMMFVILNFAFLFVIINFSLLFDDVSNYLLSDLQRKRQMYRDM